MTSWITLRKISLQKSNQCPDPALIQFFSKINVQIQSWSEKIASILQDIQSWSCPCSPLFQLSTRDEQSHIFQTSTLLLLHTLRLQLRLRKILKHQLRLLLILRKLPSNSFQKHKCLFCLMHQNMCHGYFAFDRTQRVENGHMTSTIQRDTTCWGLKLWLSLLFAQRRQTATISLPTFKLDITVNYVGHTFQTCDHFKQVCSYWQNNFRTQVFLSHEAK